MAPANGDHAATVAGRAEARDAPLLAERLLPRPDAVRSEHQLVDGGVERVYEAVRQADFVRAEPRRTRT